MDAAKSGFERIRELTNAASVVFAKHRSAFRRGRRSRRGRGDPNHTSAPGAPPRLSPMRRWRPRVRIRSVFGVKGRSCVLLMCTDAACDHGSCAAPESGKANHRDVDKQEQHKSQIDKEVNGASGLASAQKSNGPGKGGGKSEGHSQAAPDNQREQNEDHKQISEALEDVVGRSLCRAWPFKAEWFCERGPERSP